MNIGFFHLHLIKTKQKQKTVFEKILKFLPIRKQDWPSNLEFKSEIKIILTLRTTKVTFLLTFKFDLICPMVCKK